MIYYQKKLISKLALTVREIRQKKGMSQEKLAELIDSHQVYISEIETGKKIPSLPILSKIAVCFGLSLSEFITIVESRIS